MEFIRIKDLTFTYPHSDKKILNNINLQIREGDFILLIGESGCGKSTLLKHLKSELAPYGEVSGEILYKGKSINELDQRQSASEIGFVMQNPDYQIVTDKVWHELAFGLESLGYDTQTIRRRVAEMASFFGIQTWFRKDVSELSGGQKQLLNLAAIMAMQPKIIILDEPTAQLDPIAATEFLETIYKINRELGITVILTEHRLEEVFSFADKIILMDNGKVLAEEDPRKIGAVISNKNNLHRMFYSMPTPVKIFSQCEEIGKAPLTIKEGREWIRENFMLKNNNISSVKLEVALEGDNDNDSKSSSKLLKREVNESIVELKDLWFRYERNAPDILKGVNLKVYKNELFCILGGNGTGKSTTLGAITGVNKPYRGKVKVKSEGLVKLPQDPQSLFVKNTVKADLEEVFNGSKISKNEVENKIINISEMLGITELLQSHPYDLSGGEQQKAALAKVLLLEPKILILDEPTKGLDGGFKKDMAKIFMDLKAKGVTMIMVTHDIEFAAENADRCALFFDGAIASEGTPREFFCGNSFYTTAANKMTRGIINYVLTGEDVVNLWEIRR